MKIAEESKAVERARAKLLERWGQREVAEDLREKIREVHARSQADRVAVPNKPLGLFAQNQGAAEESDTVKKIRAMLEKRH